MLRDGSQKLSKVIVTIVLQVARNHLVVGISLTVLGHVDRSRIREQQEVIDAILLGLLHEPLLTVAACPVVGQV